MYEFLVFTLIIPVAQVQTRVQWKIFILIEFSQPAATNNIWSAHRTTLTFHNFMKYINDNDKIYIKSCYLCTFDCFTDWKLRHGSYLSIFLRISVDVKQWKMWWILARAKSINESKNTSGKCVHDHVQHVINFILSVCI